jgi:hypothetical protein
MQLTGARQKSIRNAVVVMARHAEPTAFAVEGVCRAAIRRALCLQAWRWARADFFADQIVTAALNVVGAKRPRWEEGQPGWVQSGMKLARYWCARCGRPLPEGHHLYCSRICAAAQQHDDRYAQFAGERREAAAVYRATVRARAPEQACERCGVMFRPGKKTQRYCRPECASSTRGIFQCV